MLLKVPNTLYPNYWSNLSSRGGNSHDREAAPKSPSVQGLSDHFKTAKSDASCREAILMAKIFSF